MDKKEFLDNIAVQFEQSEGFNLMTHYREHHEWCSLVALSVIAVIFKKYHVRLKGDDIRSTETIEDLYNLVKSKQ